MRATLLVGLAVLAITTPANGRLLHGAVGASQLSRAQIGARYWKR
jgi:hypothetical protein